MNYLNNPVPEDPVTTIILIIIMVVIIMLLGSNRVRIASECAMYDRKNGGKEVA